MDIGPINAIRSVPAIAPRRDRDLGGVFEVELRHQQQNESDSPTRRPPRGLEDDDADDEILNEEGDSGAAIPRTINCIA